MGNAIAVAIVFGRTREAAAWIYMSFVWVQLMVVRETTWAGLGMALPVLRTSTYSARRSHRDTRHQHLTNRYLNHTRVHTNS